jgi:hypothetical protein
VSSVAQVRANIAAHLAALGTLARESTEPPEFMRAPSHSPVHLEFGVSSPGDEGVARNRASKTAILVLIAYHLPPKDRVTGYDTMLALHASVGAALEATAWGAQLPKLAAITGLRSTREPGADGWIWLSITCTALHPL